MEDRANDNIQDLFSDTESDIEQFEGFDARDIRPYAEIASKAPLFCPTPVPKAKRVRIESDDSSTSSLNDNESIATVDNLTLVRTSSSSSLEGELAPGIFRRNPSKSGASLSQATVNQEETEESSGSVEGEIFVPIESKEPLQAKTTEETKEPDTSNLGTRRRGKHRSTISSPKQLTEEKCCTQKRCLQKVLSISQMTRARENFCQEYPTYEKQRRHVFNWLENNQPTDGEFTYTISGINVCWSAWTKVLGITRRRFFELKRDFLLGRRSEQHGAALTSRDTPQREAVLNFLDRYFQENCDFMPNSSVWHLTSSSRKADVFQEFKENMESTNQPICSESFFRKIWNERYSHVKIPKENRFSKCDTCCNLKEELRSTTNPMRKAALEERRKDHIAWVREERKAYISRASRAHHQPNELFSVAIDGMDTTKTELPFSKARYGTTQKAWHLRVHLVGVLVHGRHPICFLDYHQFPHDSNLMINTLLQTMWVHKDLLADSIAIQLDNTAKENKNQYVFSFLGYLVETDVFNRIEISFLPVGHTHIDVDQMFSRVSVAIERLGCLTLQDLLRILRTCYTQSQGETTQEGAKPQYATFPHLYAVREWLLPYMKQIHGLNSFHSFVIVKNDEGKAVLHFKAWCTSEWDGEQYDPIVLLRDLPQGVPEIIKPNYDAVDFARLRSMVDKCVNNGVFTNDDKQEWVNFLEEEERTASIYEDVEELVYDKDDDGAKYHKKELVYLPCNDENWLVDELRERSRPTERRNLQLSEVLRRSEVFERGEGLLPVYTGSYRRPGQVQREVIRNESRDDIIEGMLVALSLESYRERPLIGRVVELKDQALKITWLRGHWTTSWSTCKRREGQRHIEWQEEVPKASVVLFDFQLTPSGKLRQATVRELKRVYGLEQDEDSS